MTGRQLAVAVVATVVLAAPVAMAAGFISTPGPGTLPPRRSPTLTLRGSSHGRVGTTLRFAVRDRSGTGPVALRICATPPGGEPSCRRGAIPAGARATDVSVALPRPGGYAVSVAAGPAAPIVRHVWASHPSGRIVLYLAGDSEMQILDGDIAQDLAGRQVTVTSDARISSGLTKPAEFDWQREARRRAATLRPDVSVVFLGANDGFGVPGPGGGSRNCCDPGWSAGYANLVAEMTRPLLRGDAGRVYWILLPVPRPADFRSLFDAVNLGIREAARRLRGRVGLIDADAFFTPGGVYRDYMVYDGSGFTIHQPDGIHLSMVADEIAARLVVARLIFDNVIR
ncbi:MAG: GDSL-type esterase/lipase family protein [Solirubrobacteraceae bacterium]